MVVLFTETGVLSKAEHEAYPGSTGYGATERPPYGRIETP